MIKNEQLRRIDQLKRVASIAPAGSLLPPLSMFQTAAIIVPHRSIDPRAIDISSIKGRFAWEKIPLSDTYVPVIFRGTTKYFCVKMLRKLLPEYPEDIIRRSSHYQYMKPIDLFATTPNEVELLNKINAHHSHGEYSRQPFTSIDELVRVSDFLPFFEYIRLYCKPLPSSRTPSTNSLRPILPQPQETMQRSPDFVISMSTPVRGQSTVSLAAAPVPIQPYTVPGLIRENNSSAPRLIAPAPPVLRPSRPPKHDEHPLVLPQQSPNFPPTHQQLPPPPLTQQSIIALSHNIINPTSTVLPNKSPTVQIPSSVSLSSSSQSSTPTTSIMAIRSSSSDPLVSSSIVTSSRKLSTTSSQEQSISILKQSALPSSSLSVPKPSCLHSGWLQINRLYTPYISSSASNRHLYKIPISLLTFYELLKIPSSENNINELKDSSFEKISVTPQEIEHINELCLKQNIKPFSIDTKLISLSTFYQYFSANILFVKELPLIEPKASICKEWSSIVKINGGICRLRNITTLHEQTVPFIGNNLLKNFIISAQCLSAASLTKPTKSELEFLQLILFFSNMSTSLPNPQLIDIESVQKEYNVDLILLFNDKFPLNVLNYQQQDNRSATSQEQMIRSNSSAATNTFAQSTPPPSPPSPPTNQSKTSNNTPVNPPSQLPLTASSNSSNRYQKTISFHGHVLTAYICAGLGSNVQRECISIKALCNILYPNSIILDKLEIKMLRLLRLKNINRFRPQNQQSMGFTRLIDIKDAENYWDYLEQEMSSMANNDGEKNVVRAVISSLSDEGSKASALSKAENKTTMKDKQELSISKSSIEVNKGVKRPLDIESNEENAPELARVEKRTRVLEKDDNEQSTSVRSQSTGTTNDKYDDLDSDGTEDDDDDKHIRRERDSNKSKNQRITSKSLPVKTIIHRQNDEKKTNINQPFDVRVTNKSLASSQQQQTLPAKKIIKIRKRPTPRTRTNKQLKAAWVEKYNIEDCCILLDLYDPVYATE